MTPADNIAMESLGPRTRQLLTGYGLDASDLVDIESGEVSWELVDSNDSHPDADGDLLLFHRDGGQRFVGILTKPQVEELVNAWDFERRESGIQDRPISFPCGEIDDWAGIRPNSNWEDLVRGYREAVDTLAASTPRATAAPLLYLCRHLLELQLKAIIMLGQQAMSLSPDLPSHHDLQKLWTAAFPIAVKYHSDKYGNLQDVRQLVDDYHAVDPASMSFRYPVTKGNKPVDHASYVLSFSRNRHATQLKAACEILDGIINRLRFAGLMAGFSASKGRGDGEGGREG